jgi:hypothetical protein
MVGFHVLIFCFCPDVERVSEALDAAWRVLDAVECVGDSGNQHSFAGFVSVITEPALFACEELHASKTSAPGPIRALQFPTGNLIICAFFLSPFKMSAFCLIRIHLTASVNQHATEGPVHLAVARLLRLGIDRSIRCAHLLATALMPALARRPRLVRSYADELAELCMYHKPESITSNNERNAHMTGGPGADAEVSSAATFLLFFVMDVFGHRIVKCLALVLDVDRMTRPLPRRSWAQ